MAVRFYERYPMALDLNQADVVNGLDLDFQVDGSVSPLEVMDTVKANIPRRYDDPANPSKPLWLRTYKIEHQGAGLWVVPAKYTRNEPLEAGKFKLTFDTTGGTQHITQCLMSEPDPDAEPAEDPEHLETVYVEDPEDEDDPGPPVPTFNGCIGDSGEQIEGVDKVLPQFKFTITKRFKAKDLPPDYIATIYSLTGKMNVEVMTVVYKGQILIFNPGELMYHGSRPNDDVADDEWEFVYMFEYSPNVTDRHIGPITVDEKRGWDYLWIRYEISANNGANVKSPRCVIVDVIYRDGDYTSLKLDTAASLEGGGL